MVLLHSSETSNIAEHAPPSPRRRCNRSRNSPHGTLLPHTAVCSQLTATQGRVGLRAFQRFQTLSKVPRGLRGHVSKGGFDSKMTRGEAARIVQIKYLPPLTTKGTNISERNISRAKLAERYKSVMLANHPDRGGSPYLALKINEARRVLNEFAR